jgi:phosphatidylglycerol:prolipoprotein diacylglycerol transferase
MGFFILLFLLYTYRMTFLHTFEPVAIALQLGSITIYWYGIIMALAIATALLFATHTAKFFQITKETILDLSIWLIAGGLIGARMYEIFLNFPYYQTNPKEISRNINTYITICKFLT